MEQKSQTKQDLTANEAVLAAVSAIYEEFTEEGIEIEEASLLVFLGPVLTQKLNWILEKTQTQRKPRPNGTRTKL